MEESLIFIFEGATYDELILFREQIYQKHLQCVDHSLNQIPVEKQKITEYKTDTEPNSRSTSTGVSEHQSQISEESQTITENKTDTEPKSPSTSSDNPEVSEHQSLADGLMLECPFKCEYIPDSPWTYGVLNFVR